MLVFAKTDIGKAREINQDYYYLSEENSEVKLFVLADGMGGYTGGEVASKLATMSVVEYISNNFCDVEKKKDNILKLIMESIETANSKICTEGMQKEELRQMGTTLETCLIYNSKMYIGHIGDSRIYRIRNGKIEKITVDHSYVEQLVQDGKITKEEAKKHPKKNMLLKALGCNLKVEPDLFEEKLLPKDIIVICSDGLTNMIEEEEICNIIMQNLDTASENLINKANEYGGYDNISVIIIKNN